LWQRLEIKLGVTEAWAEGQLPDVLEEQIINALREKHPFDIRWNKIEKFPWESCARVLESGKTNLLE
jgi:hypothetical protein